MNVDYLKIDGSFIRDIHENPNSLNICKTIVHLAQSLNCRIIAEFVHSKEVYEVVKAIGIPYSQGYYFGMPVETIDTRSE
jgi:EAL domain-containing protein (putative c-di-GMP-specific phosphodiesterase class I)